MDEQTMLTGGVEYDCRTDSEGVPVVLDTGVKAVLHPGKYAMVVLMGWDGDAEVHSPDEMPRREIAAVLANLAELEAEVADMNNEPHLVHVDRKET